MFFWFRENHSSTSSSFLSSTSSASSKAWEMKGRDLFDPG